MLRLLSLLVLMVASVLPVSAAAAATREELSREAGALVRIVEEHARTALPVGERIETVRLSGDGIPERLGSAPSTSRVVWPASLARAALPAVHRGHRDATRGDHLPYFATAPPA